MKINYLFVCMAVILLGGMTFLANKFIINFILYINLQLIYEQSCYSYIII